ncbi:hypothetical protein FOA52_000854 [Chlamydomonas sp. UWO 241]|nr:hypothetical protein FOA52_000854 [Chlamydomonas sp. UWO 241]
MAPIIGEDLLPSAAQGLVFDCDGTLVDSMELHFTAWHATCQLPQYGLTITRKLMGDHAGVPIDRLFELVQELSEVLSGQSAGEVDREEFFAVLKDMYKTVHKPATLIEPVMDIVRAAQARALPMAVCSGGTAWHVDQALTETGIKELFGAIVTSADVSKGKPNPEGFLLAAKKIGVPPELCVGYEDAKLGLEAIEAAGFMKAVDVTVFPGYPLFG